MKIKNILSITKVARLALLAGLCAVAGLAQAQTTYYWVGRDTSPTFFGAYWSYNNNFSLSSGGSGLGSTIPTLSAFLNFDNAAVGGFTSTNDIVGGSGYQIYFKNGAQTYNLYGNAITFYDFGGANPNIQNEGAFTNHNINFPILDGNTVAPNGILNINLNTNTAQGPLTFNGTISAADAGVATRAINISGTNTVTFNGVISDFSSSGKIALTQLATNTTTLNATNTFTGAVTINAGTVKIGGAGQIGGGNYTNVITDNSVFNYGSTAAQTLSGVISGTGSLTDSGTGALTLSSSNSLSGGVTLGSGATLNLNNANALGTGTFTVSGNGSFDNITGGALSNANNNAFTLSGGSPTFIGSNNLNFGSGTVTVSGAATRTLTVNSNTLTLGGGVTEAGGARKLSKAGAGTLILNGAAGTWTGGSGLDVGTLVVGNDTALGTGNLALNSGTLIAGNGARTLANSATLTASSTVGGTNNLTLNGVFTNSGGSRTLTVLNTGTTTLAGSIFLSDDNTTGSRAMTITNVGPVVISGSISNNNAGNTVAAALTYLGTNTLTLSGSNSFSGAATISGGTVIAASSNAFTTTAGVIFNGTTGTTTLDVQTDGGDVAYPVSFGSSTIGSTLASDVKTGSVGINHTLGLLGTGNATLNIVKGLNVASGSPAITFTSASLNAGVAGTTILNPTTASLSLGAVSIASGSNPKTLQLDGTNTGNTITGVIANNLNVLTISKANSSTWTLSNAGNSYSGNTTVGGGTLNLTGGAGVTNGLFANNAGTLTLAGTFGIGSNNNNFIIGQTAGRGTLNILSGATVPRANMFVGDGAAGDGAVYQTGGTVTLSQFAGIDNLRVGSTTGGKGYYKLTGGTVTAARPAIGASLADTFGVFDMTNGTLTSTEQIHITAGSATSSGILNVMGGTVSAGTDIRMFTLAAGTAGAAQQAVLNVGGGTGAASVTTVNSASQGLNMAQTANIAGELGVVNLLTNGTLTTSRILGTSLNPTLHFNFNGGKLKANTTVASPLFNDGGVDAINVYTNGGTIDNSGVAITLGSPLLAPTGSGVSSIVIATQGSNYIGAPLVLITGGTGSGATAYAVMADDGSGKSLKVASIVVTSPGLYSVVPTTVTLVGGGAGTAASGFGFNTAANTSGTMTFIGAGATTLSGFNTYSGATTVSAGEVVGSTSGSLSNSAVTVSAGATNGVSVAAAGGQWVCSALTYSAGSTFVDFNFGGYVPSTTTAPIKVNGNLAFTGTPSLIVRSAGPTAVGQYPLIKYTGALSGTPPSVALSLPQRMTATISNNVANNSIDLVVTVGNAVNWAVGNAGWDINLTPNWKNSVGAAVNYLDGDAVVLDDTASGATPITITLSNYVSPNGIVANLTNKNYTISGSSNILGSAPLTKNGSGTLTISTTNSSYTGSIAINSGTVALSGGANIGNGSIALGTNTTLLVGAVAITGSGALTMANGSTLNMNTATTTGVGNAITVAAGATVTNTAGALGSGYSGYVTSGDSTSTLVVGGATSYSGAYQMFSNFTGTVQVNSGATLRFSSTTGGASFGGSNTTFNVLGTLSPRDQTHNTYLGAVTGNGLLGGIQTGSFTPGTATYFIGAKNIDCTFSGTITDRGNITNITALVKHGSATLTLSGNSTYSAATTVASGTLLGVTGGSSSNSVLTVASGATNGVSVAVPGGTWACSNLIYSAGTANALFAFNGNTPSTTVAPLLVQNSVTVGGTLNFLVTGSSVLIPVGTYPLISYTNTLTGGGITFPATLPLYVSGYVTNDTVNKLVSLVVTSVATPPALVWSAGTGNWDFSSPNWTNSAGATVAWADINSALLDDTATGAGPFTVTLNTNVSPIGTVFNNSTKDYTLTGTGSIAGFSGMTKSGTGTLTIANSNTFAGATTISAGTLSLGNGGTSGSLANMAIVDNGALVINRSDAVNLTTVITGSGSFTNAGGGTTTLSVTNAYAGNTTVKAGTLQMTDSGNLAPASTLVLSGGQFTRASQNFTPVKSNAYKFGLAVTANSTVATTSTSTRTVHFDSSNVTGVPGTTLFVTNAAATGTNHFKFYTGGFNYAGNLVLAGNGANNMTFLESYNTNDTQLDQIFSGVISGAGKIYKNIEGSSPGGNLIISNAANTFSGGTELRAGYIGLGTNNPLGTNSVIFGFDPNPLGFYAVDAPRTLANDIIADANSASASTAAGCTNLTIKGSQNLTLSGRILIAANVQFFTVNNSALTTFSGIISNAAANSLGIAKQGSGTLVLSGANTYNGDTFANVGILRLGASNVIPDGAGKGNLSVASTLDLNTFSETVNGLTGAGVIDTVAGGSPVLTVGNNNASASFSGAIQNTAGALGLTKTGSGTQTLAGANTYSGATTISGGTLALGAAGSIANTPSIAVSSNALFDVSAVTGGYTLGAGQTLSGFGSVKGSVTNNGTVSPGASIGTLTFSNAPVLNGTVVMELNRTNVQTSDKLVLTTSTLTYGGLLVVTNLGDAPQIGDTFTLFTAGGYAGSFTNIVFPALTGSLGWSTNNLAANGSIAVISLLSVAVSPTSTNVTYGASPVFTANTTGSGPFTYQWYDKNTNAITGETNATLTLTSPAVAASGNYTVVVTNPSASATNSGALTVTVAALSVTANNDSKTYDGTGYSGGNGVAYSGFVNGETSAVLGGALAYGGTSQNATNAGSYTIIPSGLTSANYALTFNNGTLTINPLAIGVTADAKSKVYGAADPAFTYTNTPALISGDSFTGALSRAAGTNVGTYAIIQGTLALSANYSLSYTGANLTITAATLNITANSTNKVYGTTVTFAGTEFTTAGLQFSDTVTSVSLSSAGAASSAAVGSYSIVPSAASGTGLGNYTINYINGTLTVTAASTTTALVSSSNPSGYLGSVAFTATVSPTNATGSVTFSANGTPFSTNSLTAGVATSAGISSLARGTNTITATYGGDSNFTGSSGSLGQVVTNHPPVASNAAYTRNAAQTTYKITVTNLLTNTSDADSDTVALASVGGSTNGAMVTIGGGFVLYYNTNAVADQFTYTVTDGNGGTNSASVNLAVDTTPVIGQSSIGSVSGTAVTLNFAGIPGLSYTVNRSTNLLNWAGIYTTNAPAGGLFQIVDDPAPQPNAYYQLQFNP